MSFVSIEESAQFARQPNCIADFGTTEKHIRYDKV